MIGDYTDFLNRLRAVIPPTWFPAQGTPVNDALDAILEDSLGAEIDDGTPGPPVLQGTLAGGANVQAFAYALQAFVKLQARLSTASGGWLDIAGYDFFGLRIQRQPGQSDAAWSAAIIQGIFQKRNTRPAITAVLENLTGYAPVIFEPWRIPDAQCLNVNLYYNAYGLRGSRTLPFNVFIDAYRGNGASDAEIYAAAESVRTAGITYWVQILDHA